MPAEELYAPVGEVHEGDGVKADTGPVADDQLYAPEGEPHEDDGVKEGGERDAGEQLYAPKPKGDGSHAEVAGAIIASAIKDIWFRD